MGGADDAVGGAGGLPRVSEFLAMIGPGVVYRSVDVGDFLHLEGDAAETVSVVLQGQLLLESFSSAAEPPTPIGVVGIGHLVGEEAVSSDRATRSASVSALTAASVAVIHRIDLFDVLRHKDRARFLLLELMARRVELSNRAAVASSASSVEVRIARWLLHMRDVFGHSSQPGATISATQQHLSGLAGTRRPTANRALRALQDEGFITLGRGTVRIDDPSGLERWLDRRNP